MAQETKAADLEAQEKEILHTIIQDIEEIMLNKKMSQVDLARRINTSKQFIGYFLNPNKDSLPNIKTIIKIANAMGAELHVSIKGR